MSIHVSVPEDPEGRARSHVETESEMRRLRVVFSKTGRARFISHLDLYALWKQALRRARLPVAYSQGFNPQPRLAFALALPVGYVGHREMLDLWLTEARSPKEVAGSVQTQLPQGVGLVAISEVLPKAPSLQSRVVAAHYRARLSEDAALGDLQARIDCLLAEASVPWHRVRRQQRETFDLRPLVLDLRSEEWPGGTPALRMRLRAGAGGMLRPDDLLAAMTLPPAALVERLELELAEDEGCRSAETSHFGEPL